MKTLLCVFALAAASLQPVAAAPFIDKQRRAEVPLALAAQPEGTARAEGDGEAEGVPLPAAVKAPGDADRLLAELRRLSPRVLGALSLPVATAPHLQVEGELAEDARPRPWRIELDADALTLLCAAGAAALASGKLHPVRVAAQRLVRALGLDARWPFRRRSATTSAAARAPRDG